MKGWATTLGCTGRDHLASQRWALARRPGGAQELPRRCADLQLERERVEAAVLPERAQPLQAGPVMRPICDAQR